MKRLLTVIVLVLFGMSAVDSLAGVKKIWPDQLLPEDSRDAYIQNPTEVASADTNTVWFYARVKLPVGKIVTKLTYHYLNYSGTSTAVYLHRSSFSDYNRTLAYAYSANTGSGGQLVAIDDTINKEYRKIKKGFTYFVIVKSQNQNGIIRGITITYK